VLLKVGARENSPPSQSLGRRTKGFLEGKLLEVRLDLGRWFIVKRGCADGIGQAVTEPSAIEEL
jgi:hypothetical protein